ncbi:MAG: amino acid permease [Sphingomonas sp.]|nr:amino acid permease [Sphingomonas sp.]
MNGVVGAGIFSLPSAMARLTGDWAPLAFVLCAVAIGAVVLCAAEASGRVATSGGGYGYVDAAFGPVAAFVMGTFIWIAAVLACGGIAAALADGLAASLPWLADPVPRAGFIVLVIGGLCLLNIAGVSPAARVVTVLTVVKLLPLLLLIVVGGVVLLSEGRAPASPLPPAAFGQGVILALFAFSGMETPLSASGEIENPARTIPRALFLAMGLVTVLYIAIQLVTEGLLGDALASSATPLADAMSRVSPVLGLLLLLGASLSRFAWIGSDILGAPRVLFAFARDGMLPAWLGLAHPRTHAPHIAILFHGVLAVLLAISGTFEPLAILSGLSTAVIYILICAAAWRLHRLGVTSGEGAVRYRLLPLAALVGIAAMIAIIAFGAWREIAGLCIVTVASIAWALWRRRA